MTSGQLVVAIDGGGSTTDIVAARIENDQCDNVARHSYGPCNLATGPLDSRLAFLDHALKRVLDSVGGDTVSILVIALAGLGTREGQAAVTSWAEQSNPAARVFVFSDIEFVHHLGELSLPESQTVVALVAGTGSIAIGRDRTGEQYRRAGGWGHWLGDDGSGFWIGRRALRAVMLAEEGRGANTVMTLELFDERKVDSGRQLIQTIYDEDDPVAAIAAITPRVASAASRYDDVANEILAEAGQHLADLIIAIVQQTGSANHFSLSLGGSVICQVEPVLDSIKKCLKKNSMVPRDVIIIDDPALAAVELAKAILSSD